MGVWENESRFRQELVEPMLRQVPGIINVISTHGKDEYGRDFIFDYRHPSEEEDHKIHNLFLGKDRPDGYIYSSTYQSLHESFKFYSIFINFFHSFRFIPI